MANSGYYYGLYNQKKKEAQNYEKQIKQLRSIYDSVSSGLEGKIGDVNKKIIALAEDLNSAVRHDTAFSSYVNNELENETEYPAARDTLLGRTHTALDNEIDSLSRKKNNADTEAQSYYSQYETAKRQEEEEAERARREWLASLSSFFK